jgi:hypothetical protein
MTLTVSFTLDPLGSWRSSRSAANKSSDSLEAYLEEALATQPSESESESAPSLARVARESAQGSPAGRASVVATSGVAKPSANCDREQLTLAARLKLDQLPLGRRTRTT